MESKKLAVGFILSLLSTAISFSVFMKALNHGNSAQIATSAGGFVIFLVLLISVIVHNHKRLFGRRADSEKS